MPEPVRSRLHADVASVRWLSLLAVVVLVSAVAVWVTSPRFAIEGPSLVDDWAAISRSPDQISDALRLANPEEQRFRPGWVVWNYVQWHTLDAPQGLIGPNAWNIARILVLVAGLSLLTALALPVPRGPWEAALHSALAGIPALLVVTVPKFARDIARFGTQEPLLVGGMALGGVLLVLAARTLLDAERPVPWWRIALLGVFGTGLWLIGVYQKESSVCVLPLLAAVVFVGRGRLSGWTRSSTGRRTALAVLGGIAVLPLAHVAIEIVRIASRGDLVYEAEVDSGRGVVRGVRILVDWSHEVFSGDATLVILGAVVLTGVAALVRRRLDLLAVGALSSGVLTIIFAGQSGVAVSRYYLPLYALFGVALAISLARLPRLVQLVGLAWVLVAFMPLHGVREEVSGWADEEQLGTTLVQTVAEAEAAGCPVAVAGLDLETSVALPILVGLERGREPRACEPGDRYLVVRREGVGGVPLVRACAPGALEPVMEWFVANVYRCTRLRARPVRDPELGLVEPERLVELRRLR